MSPTNIYCTLDTETVGGATKPKGIYHLGGIIHNRKGEVVGCFNYLVKEWLDEIAFDDYAKKNIGLYLAMLAEGTATLIDTEEHAIEMVNALFDCCGVNVVLAFNTGFDLTKTKCAELVEGREFIDIWLMSLETICQKKSYAKFCADNGRYNAKGNCKTNAETVFAYLTDTPNYCEEHTALEDAKIEKFIFEQCLRSHKRFTKNCHCWDYEDKWGLFPKI